MASFRQVNVRCPFYLDDDGKSRIVCEGLVGGSRIALEYRKKEDFKIQIGAFCSGRYVNCEIYRVLIEKEEYQRVILYPRIHRHKSGSVGRGGTGELR